MAPDPRILERNVAKLVKRSYRAVRPATAFRSALKESVLALATETRMLRIERPPSRSFTRWLAIAAGIAFAALLWREFTPAPVTESLDALLARGAVALRDDPQGPWRAAETDRIVVPAASFLEVKTPGAAHAAAFTVDAIAGRCEVRAASHAEIATAAGGAADAPELQIWLHAGSARIDTNARDRVVTNEGSITFGPGTLDVGYARNERAGDLSRLPVRIDVVDGGSGETIVDDATPPQLLAASGAWMLYERVARPWDAEPREPADPVVARREASDPDPNTNAVTAPADEPGLVRVHAVDAATGLPIPRVRVTLLTIERIFADGRRVPAYGMGAESKELDTDAGIADVLVESSGVFKLYVSAPNHATWQSERFESASDAPARVFEVALDAGVTLSGVVVDAVDGAPIAGALVFSETETPALGVPVAHEWLTTFGLEKVTRIARTDAEGRFELAHAARLDQRLRAMAPGRGAQVLRLDDFDVNAARGDLRFELGPSGAVAGRVLDTTGKPLAKQLVVAVSQTQRADELAAPLGFSLTGDDGAYRIDELAQGLWIIVHMGEDEPMTAAQRVRSARVLSGETALANFGGGAYVVRGIARSPDGKPLVEATLSLSHEDEDNRDDGQWIGVTTDAEGRFSTGLDRTGRYGVVLIENAGQRISIVGSFEVADVPVTDVELRMPTGVVSGRVLHADSGEPVPFAHVIVMHAALDGTTTFAGHTTADAKGSFQTAPFESAGAYTVVSFSGDAALGVGLVTGVQVTAGQSATGVELRMPRGGSIVVAPQAGAGAPVSGAVVELVDARGVTLSSDYCATTGALGEKRFAGVDATRWTVHVRAPGFAPFESTCDVPLGGEVRVIAALDPAAK